MFLNYLVNQEGIEKEDKSTEEIKESSTDNLEETESDQDEDSQVRKIAPNLPNL